MVSHKFTIETEKEKDGRWIAEVVELPGVLTYGKTRKTAQAGAEALALRVLAEKLEHPTSSKSANFSNITFLLP